MTDREDQFELPDKLAARLEARDRAVSVLTPDVDRAVLAAARRQFAPRTRVQRSFRRWAVPVAAAAMVVLAVTILIPLSRDDRNLSLMADDIDGSGRVDILDAFALARIRAASPGAVDEQRIQSLAEQIVALNGGG